MPPLFFNRKQPKKKLSVTLFNVLPLLMLGIFTSGLITSGLLLQLEANAASQPALVTQQSTRRLSIEVDNASLPEVLRQIAQRGHLNLVLNQAVTGQVSVSLHNVTPLEAIETICQISGLGFSKQGSNILLVAPLSSTQILGLQRSQASVFQLKYANASRIATLLQQGIFNSSNSSSTSSSGGSGSGSPSIPSNTSGSQAPTLQADMKNNQLLVMGSADQVKLIADLIPQLDKQRERRVYQLSYANSVQVAQQLNASIFNDGDAGGGGGATTVGGPTINIAQEQITEGSGSNSVGQTGNASSGGGGGSSSTTASSSSTNGTSGSSSTNTNSIGGSSGLNATGSSVGSLPSSITVRSQTMTSGTFAVPSMGAVAIPDTRLNTLTVFASPQQFQSVETLLSLLDSRPAQVSIQATLVEVSASSLKTLGALFQYNDGGKWGFTLGSLSPGGLSQAIYNQSGGLGDILSVQLNALYQTGKAKNLANPSIVATHDSETVISIVDDILRGESFSTGNSQFFGQTSPLIGQAGIILDILPKIGANGTVTMRVRPSVTSVYDKIVSGTSTIQLVRSRDLVAQQVQVKDGQTLIIGGLLDNRTTQSQSKLPGLADLPIVGAMFRSTSTSTNRSELLIMLTPHILNQLEPTPVRRIDKGDAYAVPAMEQSQEGEAW
jgi:general secretion pathway protein D